MLRLFYLSFSCCVLDVVIVLRFSCFVRDVVVDFRAIHVYVCLIVIAFFVVFVFCSRCWCLSFGHSGVLVVMLLL